MSAQSSVCPVCHQQFVSPLRAAQAVLHFGQSIGALPVHNAVFRSRVRLVFASSAQAALCASLLSEQVFSAAPCSPLFAVAFGVIRQRGAVVILSGFRCAC